MKQCSSPRWQSALLISLFFLWGVANNLNDILIKQFQKAFTLSDMRASLVQSAFYFGYFFGALPAAKVARSYGYKTSILVGLCLFSLGSFAFLPASHNGGSFPAFLFCLYVLAFGLAFLESSANPWIVVLADAREPGTGTKALNIAQSFNPLGSIVGILIGRLAILDGLEYSPEAKAELGPAALWEYRRYEAGLVGPPYALLGLGAAAVAVAFGCTSFPADQEVAEEEAAAAKEEEEESSTLKVKGDEDGCSKGGDDEEGKEEEKKEEASVEDKEEAEAAKGHLLTMSTAGRLFRNPAYVQGLAAIFLSVGAQVCMWSFIIRYVQANVEGVSELRAADCILLSLLLYVAGRFTASALMALLGPGREPQLLVAFNLAGAGCCAAAAVVGGAVGVVAVCFSSFFIGISFPTVFGLSISAVDQADTEVAGAMLVMCVVGGAVITPLMGVVSDGASISLSYLVPATCMALVAMLGLQHVLGRAGGKRSSSSEPAPLE